MAVTPEMIFPSGLKEFKGEPKFLLGNRWYKNSTDGSQYGFKTVKEIDISQFPHGSYTAQNPFRVPICTWENDLVLKLSMYLSGGVIYANLRLYYNNEELTYAQHQSAGWAGLSNAPYAYQPLLAVQATGHQYTIAKLMVFNDYGNQPPTENITPVQDFVFSLWIPSYRNITTVPGEPEVLVYNDLSRVIDGTVKVEFGEGGLLEADRSSAGSHRCDPYRCGWVFNNLTQFNTFMKTAGSGMPGDAAGGDSSEPDTPEEDTSGTGGGGGTYDPTSDPIDFPTLPTGGALTSGMIKGFVIGSGNLINLQQKLWNMSIFDIETQFQKLVNQPLECIISLHCLPCLPLTGNPENIKLGSFDTEVTGNRITNQYLTIDGGTLTVPKYWGSALDYAPYSRAEIFIPFIGFRNLQIEDIQGLTLTLKYHVDVLTGDCVAYLKCGNSVLYSWTGNCLSHIPVMASSSDLLAKGIAAVGSIGVGLVTGNPASTAGGVISAASNVVTAKNHVQRSGDVAGSPGVMSDYTPYIVFHRPKQSLAANYNVFKGYPSNITYTLSSLSGYTEVEHVHLTGIKATDTELQEIENLLKSGVII